MNGYARMEKETEKNSLPNPTLSSAALGTVVVSGTFLTLAFVIFSVVLADLAAVHAEEH